MRFPRSPVLVSAVLASGLASAQAEPTRGDQTVRDLTGYLPAKTPIVADLHDGSACVRALLDWIEPLPDRLPPAGRVFLMSLPLLTKAQTGMDLTDLLEVLMPSQAAFAFFPDSGGGEGERGKPFPVFLARVSEADEVTRVLRRLRSKAGFHFSIDAGVLTVTDTPAHLTTAQKFRRSGQPTLLHDAGYRRGRAATNPRHSVRFYVDLATIRDRYSDRSYWDNLDEGARIFFGPLVRVLDLAGRLDGRLEFTDRTLHLDGRADADLGEDPKKVGDLIAAGAVDREVPSFPKDTMACLALDRNLGSLLHHPDRWLGDDGALGVKSFLSVADQILGGSSLLDDLLPNIEMPMTFFVTGTTPDEFDEQPRIHLPAFTLVFGLGDDEKTAPKLLDRAMRTITAIANVQRIQDKQTPIAVRSARRGGYKLKQVRFGDWHGPGDPPTEQGLSPTLLFAHGHGIVSSTADGAERMASALATGLTKRVRGDFLSLEGGPIADLLVKNLRVLTVDRVLEEGETLEEADGFFRSIEAVLRLLTLDGNIKQEAGSTRFQLELRRQR